MGRVLKYVLLTIGVSTVLGAALFGYLIRVSNNEGHESLPALHAQADRLLKQFFDGKLDCTSDDLAANLKKACTNGDLNSLKTSLQTKLGSRGTSELNESKFGSKKTLPNKLQVSVFLNTKYERDQDVIEALVFLREGSTPFQLAGFRVNSKQLLK